ncbi:MAG: hypothetical protein Q8L95_03015 [Burkholderiales bacterium]|nr:hypothetical protein [Burkholderiales bacterium]
MFDFIVYSENHLTLPDGGHRIITAPTKLRVPASIRRRIAAIPDLAWVRIYDRLYSGSPYFVQPLPDANECFYVKCGNSTHEFVLQSSRLLVVHRKTGKVLYAGSANDEG